MRWKPIYGWPYDVSDTGRVRRAEGGRGAREGRILAIEHNGKGYSRVKLCDGGHEQYYFVHVLVAEAFIGPCPPGCEVSHKNNVRDDNRVDNLEYLTHAENIRKARDDRNMTRGESHPKAVLDSDTVRRIRAMAATGQSGGSIARELGLQSGTVRAVITGKSWGHVA